MIEHSISKYKPTPVAQTYEHNKHNGLQKWSQLRCECYIKDLLARGFTPGTKIKTKWGIDGVIEAYPTPQIQGMQFYGKTVPDIIKVKVGQYGNCMHYNEEEITSLNNQLEFTC